MGASQVTLPTLWLALSSVTLVGVLVLVALVRDWRRRLRDARNELAPLRVQLAELGLQVRQLSAELQALRRAAVENNMGRGRSGGGSPYNQAIELVRQGVLGWTELIRSHPRVTLLTATAENRDAMPQTIAALIAKGDSHA